MTDYKHEVSVTSSGEIEIESYISIYVSILYVSVTWGLSNDSTGVMSPKILLDCVQTETLVSDNAKCKFLLDEATAYHLLPQVGQTVNFPVFLKCSVNNLFLCFR